MKVAQSDLIHLFSASTPTVEPSAEAKDVERELPAVTGLAAEASTQGAAPVQAAPFVSATVPAPLVPTREPDSGFTALHREVASALPALWAKAKKQNLSRSEERKKLRSLLAWLAGKKGLLVQEVAPMRYRYESQTIDGRVDLLVKGGDGAALMAVEADWSLQEASVAKLKAAHERGIPVLWILGTPAKTRQDAREARKFAARVVGREAGGWLVIFHLEHGWL